MGGYADPRLHRAVLSETRWCFAVEYMRFPFALWPVRLAETRRSYGGRLEGARGAASGSLVAAAAVGGAKATSCLENKHVLREGG